VSPDEHLRQAKTALNSVSATAVTGRARTQLAELKRHLTALERASSSTSAATRSATGAAHTTRGSAARPNANWGTEVAAMDKILAELTDSNATSGSTGTSGAGTASATGTAGTRSRAAGAVTMDDATRAKLMEVRTHITAYATGMSGSQGTPQSDASAMSSPTTSSTRTSASAADAQAPANAQSADPESRTAQSSTAQGNTAQSNSAESNAAQGSTAQGSAAQSNTTQSETAQSSTTQATSAATAQVDAEAARRSLTAARDTLSQLTQLPAAAQLSGEARTQVSQLIANFNELITAQSNWRASYAKVAANLDAVLGPDNTDAEATQGAPVTATAQGAPPTGTVGTSGSAVASLDPAVRAKLIELRRNLSDFEKASGGRQ
jgi:hypothetical protein